jgi:hypothetical protein
MEWKPIDTPDTVPDKLNSLYSPVVFGLGEGGSEIIKLLIGNDGYRMYAIVSRVVTDPAIFSKVELFSSADGGVSWSGGLYANLAETITGSKLSTVIVHDIAIAPNDPDIIVAVVSLVSAIQSQMVLISLDGGINWANTQWPPSGAQAPAAGYAVSAVDISEDYGNRDLLIGVRNGAAPSVNNLWTMKILGFGGWNVQSSNGQPASINSFTGDVIDAKFSPTYSGDATIAVVYSTNTGVATTTGTYIITGARDLAANLTTWQPSGSAVEIKRPDDSAGASPGSTEIITADLEMPSDFSGQSASLRRFYVCTDAIGPNNGTVARGVFRIDDNIIYCLMDNSTTFQYQADNRRGRRAASIAYWGTYASGKLLVGERLGNVCTATVPVWFTDSPTVCPIPCWYPAKKPPTGAAGHYDDWTSCTPDLHGYGNAWVVWSPTLASQGVAYTVTGAMSYDGGFAAFTDQLNDQLSWPGGKFNVVVLDESAFSLTRNNGETWNQLSLIDTRIIKLTDVAPSADCTTVFLASVNDGPQCQGFDSVWRSSINEKVVSPPLPALPIGQIWERVLTRMTGVSCNQSQTEYAILRVAPDKIDGQVLGWAAGGVSGLDTIGNLDVGAAAPSGDAGGNTRAMAWSPDFGDYWADISPRISVQDFAFESSTILYVLDYAGNIQKLPYTGTAWSSSINNVDSNLGGGHTIEAIASDKVLVGNRAGASTPSAASISLNGGATFIPMAKPLPTLATVGYHAIFDTDFDNNSTIYAGSDGGSSSAIIPAVGATTGLVYRNSAPSGSDADWTDMMSGMSYGGYTGPHEGYHGLVQSNSRNVTSQGTLYAAHTWENEAVPAPARTWSGVERTRPWFSLEPKSLKLCGCLTQDTDTKLYAIDNNMYSNIHNVDAGRLDRTGTAMTDVRSTGLLWVYTDCMAKRGPNLTMDEGTIVGCDPATGRAQEVNFTWEQLCIATHYKLHIAKDQGFTLRVYESGVFKPSSVTSPAMVFMTGGVTLSANDAPAALECGHTYVWRLKVYNETTDDYVDSPYSEKRTFTIKAGFKVTTPYYGPQLLTPDNGCGCPCDAPINFSWSPFKETTAYKFELSENFDMSSPLVSTTVTLNRRQASGVQYSAS